MESVNVMRRLLLSTPPDPTCRDWRSFKETAKFIWEYVASATSCFRLVDLMTMSADDYLSEWFESTHIKRCWPITAASALSPGRRARAPAYVVMHHLMGEHAAPAAGASCAAAWAPSPRQSPRRQEKGVVIRTDSAGRLDRHERRPGDRRDAHRRHALRGQDRGEQRLGQADLPGLHRPRSAAGDFVRDVESYRTYSTAFKINIACERLPQYTGFKPEAAGFATRPTTHVGPTIDYLERAYDDAKYGDMSREPFVTPVTPTYVTTRCGRPGSTSSTCSAATRRTR